MTELTLRIEDETLLPSLKRILKALHGVAIIRPTKTKALSKEIVSSKKSSRRAHVVSRGNQLSDEELNAALSGYPPINNVTDVVAEKFVRDNSAKAIQPIDKWL